MIPYPLKTKARLAKWLLIVGVFCGLLTFSGTNTYRYTPLRLPAKTELFAPARQVTGQSEKWAKVTKSRSFIARNVYPYGTLAIYNQ